MATTDALAAIFACPPWSRCPHPFPGSVAAVRGRSHQERPLLFRHRQTPGISFA